MSAAASAGQVLVVFALGVAGLLRGGRRRVRHRAVLQRAALPPERRRRRRAGRRERPDPGRVVRRRRGRGARQSWPGTSSATRTGSSPPCRRSTPVYESGHAGDAAYLSNGILISGGDIRVAVRTRSPTRSGGSSGSTGAPIGGPGAGQARGQPAADRGPPLRQLPGPGHRRSYPVHRRRAGVHRLLRDGRDRLPRQRHRQPPCGSPRTPGAAFDRGHPGQRPTQPRADRRDPRRGRDADNGADFRGFVALDIRNFANTTSQLYYNEVDASTTREHAQGRWRPSGSPAGGYPGPLFPPVISPPDPNDQVATMSGNSTGVGIDGLQHPVRARRRRSSSRSTPGRPWRSPTSRWPPPSTIALPTTGTLANAGSFQVGRNQSFSGQVTLTTVADTGDPDNPMVDRDAPRRGDPDHLLARTRSRRRSARARSSR